MYRPKSTDVWFNLPEVVAAYQPVACPGGELLARINVANNQQSPSLHRLIPVVAPVFDPRYGWQFDGATTYFNGGPSFAVNQRASFFWQWSGWTAGIPYGWYQTYAAFVAAQIIPSGVLSRNGDARFPVTNAPAFAAGNYGVAGRNCFRNGKQEPPVQR